MSQVEAAQKVRRPVDGPASSLKRQLTHVLGTHALLILLLVLAVVFSVLKPNRFPTLGNLNSIIATSSVTVILALGVLVPFLVGEFDLSVGYNVALTNCLIVGLQIRNGLPWEIAVVAGILVGTLIGALNGVLVAYLRVDSFIATLGSGTLLYGIANWYTGGNQISGALGSGFLSLSSNWTGIPNIGLFALLLGVVLWIAIEYVPFGRHFYAIGANRRAAELSGIKSRARIVLAFVISGGLSAAAAAFLASQLQIGQANTGSSYLLPAFAAVLLGATSVRPGRVNVWGTVIAVLLLAVAVAGLQQFGLPFYVEYILNGAIVIVAVAAAGFASRRRTGQMAAACRALLHEP